MATTDFVYPGAAPTGTDGYVSVRAQGAVAANSTTTSATLTTTVVIPAGYQPGDLAILHVSYSTTATAAPATPNGWGVLASNTNQIIFWSRLVASNPNASVVTSYTTTGWQTGQITVLRGAKKTGFPFVDVATSSDVYVYNANTTNLLTWPSYVPTATGLTMVMMTNRRYSTTTETFNSNTTPRFQTSNRYATNYLTNITAPSGNTEYASQYAMYLGVNSGTATNPDQFITSAYAGSTTTNNTSYQNQFTVLPEGTNAPEFKAASDPVTASRASQANVPLSVTTAVPTGWAERDYAILVLAAGQDSASAITVNPPAGWTFIADTNTGGNYQALRFYARRMVDGDDPSVTISVTATVTSSNLTNIRAQVLLYTGITVTDNVPISNVVQLSTTPLYSNTPYQLRAIPQVVSAGKNARVVLIGSCFDTNSSTTYTVDPSSQLNERTDSFLRNGFYGEHFYVSDFATGEDGSYVLDGLYLPLQYSNPFKYATITLRNTAGVEESSDSYKGSLHNTSPQTTPTFVGVGAIASTASTAAAAVRTIAPALNASTVSGDLVFAFIQTVGSNNDITPVTAGVWTPLSDTIAVGNNNSGEAIAHRTFYRYHDGVTANGSFQSLLVAGTSNGAISGVTQTYRGAGTSNSIEGFNFRTSPASSTTAYAGVPITTNRANSLLIQGYGHTGNAAATPPSGWTERQDVVASAPTATNGHGQQINTIAVAGLTTTTGGNETFANAGNFAVIIYGFAISASARISDRYTTFDDKEDNDSYAGTYDVASGPQLNLAASEGADSFAADFAVLANSNVQLSASENNDTFSGSSAVVSSLNLTDTEDNDTFSGSAAVQSTTTLAATETNDSFAGSVSARTSATLTVTEQNDTLAGSVSSTTPMVLATSEANDTWAADPFTATTSANLTATEGQDTYAGVLSTRVEMTFAATEQRDAYAGMAVITSTLTLGNSTENPDAYAGSVSASTNATLAVTEGRDVYNGMGGSTTYIEMTATETGTDSFSGSTTATTPIVLNATEQRDAYAGTHAVVGSANLTATEANDTAQFNFDNRTVMTVAIVEGKDTFAGSTTINSNLTFAGVEPTRDSYAGTHAVTSSATLAATEASDSYAATISSTTQLALVVSESNDTLQGAVVASTDARLTASEARDGYTGTFGLTASVTLSGAEFRDSFTGSLSSVTYTQVAITEGRDGFSASVEAITSATLAATESNDTLQGSYGIVAYAILAGFESGYDDYEGRIKNDLYQNDLYVKGPDGWISVDPVLVKVAGSWVEPKSGYVRSNSGTWVKIYGKP